MEFWQSILVAVFGGLCLGGLVLWLVLRGRAALLSERLEDRQEALGELETERGRLVEQLRVEAERRSVAEEKNSRIPDLESALAAREQKIDNLNEEVSSLREQRAGLDMRLQEEEQATEEKMELLRKSREEMTNAFNSLAGKALKSNNESFLNLARETFERHKETAQGDLEKRQKAIGELVKPLGESLEKVQTRIQEIETERTKAYSTLSEQVRQMATTQTRLQAETHNLVTALRAPKARGRWGEIQLQRVVEMAGMLEYCDFQQQVTTDTEEGRRIPDLVVKLPNERVIVVDSKVALDAYLRALEADDEDVREIALRDHARQVRDHITALSRKNYWRHLDSTPEFVVLFMPGEIFFSAALEKDPALIEYGVENNVLVGTPTTLIALLKSVAYGWQQQRIAKSARAVSDLGRELYDRICTLAGHMDSIGGGLQTAVSNYNRAVGSLESRVLVTARRFRELDAATEKDLDAPRQVEEGQRQLQSEEWRRLPHEEKQTESAED